MTKVQFYFLGSAVQALTLSAQLYFDETIIFKAFTLLMIGVANIAIMVAIPIIYRLYTDYICVFFGRKS